jgi:predicted HTH transcriptional regulator
MGRLEFKAGWNPEQIQHSVCAFANDINNWGGVDQYLLQNPTRLPAYRAGSRSLVAQGATLTRLMELTAKVPFDDRINQQSQLNDLDLGLIREFLQEVGSDLFDESVNIPFPELCRQMQIARGPAESKTFHKSAPAN